MSTVKEDEVAARLYALLNEAVELRFGTANDPEGELHIPAYEVGNPEQFIHVLVRARQRADRVEFLLNQAKKIRNALAMRKREADDAEQDRLDQALSQGKKVEFKTRDETMAEARLQSFDERRAARLAARRAEVAHQVVEAINDIHWGLSGLRTDLREVLRSFQFESNMER